MITVFRINVSTHIKCNFYRTKANLKDCRTQYLSLSAYITLFANPYGHYTVEWIDTFGVIWPIMLEVAFTATIVLVCDKIWIFCHIIDKTFAPPRVKSLQKAIQAIDSHLRND